MKRKTIRFLNLTNGLEKLPTLRKLRLEINFIRIQSTTIERKCWIKLLTDLDHNLLFNLAIGNECIVWDCGTNREISKTIYLGVPLIRYCLSRYWLEVTPDNIFRIGRTGTITNQKLDNYFDEIYKELFVFNSTKEKELMKTKLRYYRKFLLTKEIKLIGCSISTANDGNYNYFKKIAKKYG